MARCPAHDDRTPSLSIRDADDGKVLVRCHAGCDQERVIAALRGRGLWADERSALAFAQRAPHACRAQAGSRRRQAQRGGACHLAIRQAGEGTPVETYLASRGIDLPPPDALRFHAGLKHPSGGIWPAMVALVTHGADGTPLAIHRTFLAARWRREGAGRAAEDDARPLPWRCGAPRPSGRRADGRRRHRDLPRRHAGDRPSRLGGAFDFRTARARSAEATCAT